MPEQLQLPFSRRQASLDRLIIGAILLLAVAMWVYRLDAQSLWYDEAITARVASMTLSELTHWTAGDIQPPLYYYFVHGWISLAGRGEWALRFPSALFSVATVALLWSLAKRLLGRGAPARWAAHIVALLAAVSPLYVYYAQEARMYAQLTFFSALTGYVLLRAATDISDSRRTAGAWWVIFACSSLAMLYTHYFGAALLLAFAIILVCAWCVRGLHGWSAHAARRQVGGALAATIAILVGYAPWLPSMWTRYRVDRSYWQGALKLGEALRHVAISFTSGAPDTMLESSAVHLLPYFGLVLAVSLITLLLSRGPDGVRRLKESLILVGVLVIPVVAVLWLASRTPKFNARYLMLVSPAYLLLLAAGIGSMVANAGTALPGSSLGLVGPPQRAAVRKSTSLVARWILASGMMAFVVAVSLSAVHGWFTDPAFTKAQWRELAGAVRAEIQPGEAVFLVSGHAAPAWNYYAPDLVPVLLPNIDVLDTGAVLGFDSGAELGRGLVGKQGVWLVEWQADTVDPVGFVPFFLDRAGAELPVAERFWQLGLRHWQLEPGATYEAQPNPVHADGANFQHQIALMGWDPPQEGMLTVYWRAVAPLDRDFKISMVIEDAAGRELGRWDGRPATYDYPTTRWIPDHAVFGRYLLPTDDVEADLYVTLAVYDDSDPSGLDVMDVADNPAGKRIRLGPIAVAGAR